MSFTTARLRVALALTCCAGVFGDTVAARRTQDALSTVEGTARLSGIVVTSDAMPQPVRRAIVTLSGGGLPHGKSAITDDQGQFAFDRLPEGRFTITASRPAFVTSSYGAKQPGRPGTAITLTPGQQLTDVAITLARGGVITGVIRDQAGEPIPGIPVVIVRAGPAGGTMTAANPMDTIVADDRGVYRVYGLQPGKYVVAASVRTGAGGEVRIMSPQTIDAALTSLQGRAGPMGGARGAAPGRAGGAGNAASAPKSNQVFAPIFFPGTANPAEATVVTVSAGEERGGVDFIVRPVPSGTIEGVVTNPTGGPPTAQLSITPETPVELPALFGSRPILTVAPGPDGHFKYTSLTPGRYTIAARSTTATARAGGAGGFVTMAPAAPSAPGAPPPLWAMATVNVDGNDVTGVALTLDTALKLSGRTVFDRTTLDLPKDLATIRVILSQPGNMGTSMMNGTMFGRLPVPAATVRADGTFEFAGVFPGTYRITASVPSESRWWLRSAMQGDRDLVDLPLEINGNGDLPSVVLTFSDRRTELSGTLQTSGGAPALDYYVVVFPADRALWRPQARRFASTRPASDGHFVVRDLPAGEYLLAALTDLDPDEWQLPAFLDQLVGASVRVALDEGERKTQNLRIAR